MKVPLALLAYALVLAVSRLGFRHRDRVQTGPGGTGRSGQWRSGLLCLLPLVLMQMAPFFEYMLRYQGILGPPLAGAPLFIPAAASSGLLVFAAGTALAAVASRQLGRAWQASPGTLFTGGLYSVIRHPMYAGYLVQGAGCMLMLGALWSWALYGLAVPLVFARIAVEDRELAELFPEEFEAYRAQVRRLIPWVF
jgi:protein-S-isoprenylcysteine O-methyltransferase Ste14